MEWISVKDRLPEYDKCVIVAWKHGNGKKRYGWVMKLVDKSDRCGLKWEDPQNRISDYCEVTHWMELPSLPKEEKQGHVDTSK